MASAGQWLEGARPRTLPAAISPVLAGTGAAAALDGFAAGKAVLALVVALALQVGVNFANDYSDGVRGTDAARVGPLRLVGSGAATPPAVRAAALAAFGVGAVAGLVLALTSAWWLIVVGAAAVAAGWFYTGGPRPYGYRGLGEVSVFCFFGLVAVLGTTYTQAGRISAAAVAAAVAMGLHACALLMANNVRDVPTDADAGKRTLAVRLGEGRSRVVYVAMVAVAYASIAVMGAWAALLGLAAAPLSIAAARSMLRGTRGLALIPVLRLTGQAQLLFAVGIGVGLALSG
ncbi:MAG: 1,4-dihydroxy-2-naphthoate polyprenyltransferase [bacterium]